MTFKMVMISALISVGSLASATNASRALPQAPDDPVHPGSLFYSYGANEKTIDCDGRTVRVFLPDSDLASESYPVVVFGHGQLLGVGNYRLTFQHLAKKGVATIFPDYDSWVFDTDFLRMGKDFAALTECALTRFSHLDQTKIIFSGHSKGAFVASIAAGLHTLAKPKIVILFESAGVIESVTSQMDPDISLTVVFSDADSIVERRISETTFRLSPSRKKQFIFLKSYSTNLQADHFWPETKGMLFGAEGGSSLHYFGDWKWLVAAAWDLRDGGHLTNPYLFGEEATNKGIPGFSDDVIRNF